MPGTRQARRCRRRDTLRQLYQLSSAARSHWIELPQATAQWCGVGAGSSQTAELAPNNACTSGAVGLWLFGNTSATFATSANGVVEMTLESANIYYGSSAGLAISAYGWTDNL